MSILNSFVNIQYLIILKMNLKTCLKSSGPNLKELLIAKVGKFEEINDTIASTLLFSVLV